jgi:hypothetical protein
MDRGTPLARLFKEPVMPSPDSKTRARAELLDLIESQLNTLEKGNLRLRHRGRKNSANTRAGATASLNLH